MYSELVDFMAASLYAVVETSDSLEIDKADDLKHYFNWFYKYMKENDNTEHDGDCTQMPYSCHQCCIDSQRDKAILLINKQAFDQYLIDEELCEVSGN